MPRSFKPHWQSWTRVWMHTYFFFLISLKVTHRLCVHRLSSWVLNLWMCVCACLYTLLYWKNWDVNLAYVTHWVSFFMPTHCCISDAESVNYSRLPQLPKAVWVFLCVYTSFIHFRRNNLHRTSCSKRTRHTQGTKLFIVVVFAYKGTTNHLGALSEKGQSKAWITHEVTVPCSPPSPLHRWLSQEAPPDDLFATTHLSHYSELLNKPTEVELSYKSQ